MDPDYNLKSQKEHAERLRADKYLSTQAKLADAERLAELVLTLDAWLRSGNSLPLAWSPRG